MLISRDYLMKVGTVVPPTFWQKKHRHLSPSEYRQAEIEHHKSQLPTIATAISKLVKAYNVSSFKEQDIGIARHVGAKRHQYDALELQKALELGALGPSTMIGRSFEKLAHEVKRYRLNSKLKKLRKFSNEKDLRKFTNICIKDCAFIQVDSSRDWCFSRTTATASRSHIFTIQDNKLRWQSNHKEGAYDFERNLDAQLWVEQYIIPKVKCA